MVKLVQLNEKDAANDPDKMNMKFYYPESYHNCIRTLSKKSLRNQEAINTQTKDRLSTAPPLFHLKKIYSTNNFYAHERLHIPSCKRDKQRRRKCGLFLRPEQCCCLICSMLITIGLCAAITATVLKILPSTSRTTAASTSISAVVIATTTIPFNSTFNTNLLINGDGETGSCQNSSGITHPMGWNYNGTITQMLYNVSTYGVLTYTDSGPSDRGNCYFFGQISSTTSMWQTVNLTNTIDPLLIDNHTVKFNLSAWIGGWSAQNDNARISVTFYDQTNQIIGNQTTIGPVLAVDRGSQSSLLFRQATDYVPISARSFTVRVLITSVILPSNDGAVDNMGIYLYT